MAGINWILDLTDRMSGKLSRTQAAAQTAFGRIDNAAQRMQQNLNKTGNVKVAVDTSDVERANRKVSELQRNVNRLGRGGAGGNGAGVSGGGGMGVPMWMGGAALVAGGSAGLGMLAKTGMAAGANEMAFKVLAGDKQGAALYKDLKKYVQESIFGPELYDAAKTMMAYGVAVDKVIPSIKRLGDISMGNKEHLNSLTLAYSQTMAAGRLQGQDNLQYVAAGFNPLQELTKMTGKSMVQLRDDMEKGAISSKMVAAAIEHATSAGGKFYNMAVRMGETPFGRWSAEMGNMENLAQTMGQQLDPAIMSVTRHIHSMTDEGMKQESVFGGFVKGTLVPLIDKTAGAAKWAYKHREAIKAVAEVVAPLALGIWAATTATKAWEGALKSVGGLMALPGWAKGLGIGTAVYAGLRELNNILTDHLKEDEKVGFENGYAYLKGFKKGMNEPTVLQELQVGAQNLLEAVTKPFTKQSWIYMAATAMNNPAASVLSQTKWTPYVGGNYVVKAAPRAPIGDVGGSKAGMSPAGMDMGGGGDAVVGGRSKQIIINMHRELVSIKELHVAGVAQGKREIEQMCREAMIEVLKSIDSE